MRQQATERAFPNWTWEHGPTASWASAGVRITVGVLDKGTVRIVLKQCGSVDSVCLVNRSWRTHLDIRHAVRAAADVLRRRADALWSDEAGQKSY